MSGRTGIAVAEANERYRDIAVRLEEAGYVNERGVRYHPELIRHMVEGDAPAAGGDLKADFAGHL